MRRSILLCGLLLAGCASPDPRLYTLLPTDPASPPAGLSAPLPVVEVRRVDIPGYLDRPEVVRSAADYRVHLTGNDRWGEPFGDLLTRVLTADIARRLPGATVYEASGGLSAPAGAVVEVAVARLDPDGAGLMVLDARVAVETPGDEAAVVTRPVHLTIPTRGDTAGYAAAISAATGQLADVIAALLAPPPPAPAASPGQS